MNDSIIKSQKAALLGLISEASSIGIVIPENQNLDKMAAALSLYLSLLEAGRNVSVVSKRDPVVALSNLVGVDKIKKEFSGDAKKVVVSLPYKEGEIEKVSYNIEGARLNINLFASKNASISFKEDEVEYIKNGATPSLIFAIGLKNAQELSGFLGDSSNVKVVLIDGAQTTNFGDIALSDPSFSSLSEVVAIMLKELMLPIDLDIAQNLMDGIISVTNNFTSGNTSAWAFEAAGILLRNGGKRRGQQNRSQKQNSLPQLSEIRPERQEFSSQSSNSRSQASSFQPQPALNQENKQEIKQDSVPSDWFVPKVFKSSRQNQGS